MEQEEGLCVGCNDVTTDTIECDCTREVFACGVCCGSDALVRCAACRERDQRFGVYPCLEFRGDPETGGDTDGCLPAAAVAGAWGPP